MSAKRFKSRCYEKQQNTVIYDDGEKLFDVSYRNFEDAFYLKMKLIPVIDKLNELNDENKFLNKQHNIYRDVSKRDAREIKELMELQVQCNLLREQANEFHRGAIENVNRAGQLERENKKLKAFLKELGDSQGNIYHGNGRVYNIQEVI